MKIEFQRRFNFLTREPLDVENIRKHRLRRILKNNFMSQDDVDILKEPDLDAV